MGRAQTVACLVLTVVLSGCTVVGPDYERPKQAIFNRVSANAAFRNQVQGLFDPGPVEANWWRLYQDSTLDSLVQEALRANTDLRIALANLARAQAASNLAVAAREPATLLALAPSYSRRSAEEELAGRSPLPNNWTYGATIGVSYQVDLFGQITRSIEAADAELAASRATLESVRVTVVAETTRAYIDACAAGRELQVAYRLVDVQSRTIALTERLLSGGKAIALDVVRSGAQEDEARARVPALSARKQLAVYRLAALTARVPGDASTDAQTCEQEPKLRRSIPIGEGAGLLRRRPDVRRAEHELRAATARIGVAVADLYPKVVLGASLGSVGLARDAFQDGTFKFSVGPLISWQFPDRSLVRARIEGARAEEAAAYARFDGVVLTALRETESALVLYAQDLETQRFLEASSVKAVRAAVDTDRLYAAGRVGFLSVLDATRTRTAAEQAVAAASSKVANDQVSLFLALGGGWE